MSLSTTFGVRILVSTVAERFVGSWIFLILFFDSLSRILTALKGSMFVTTDSTSTAGGIGSGT